ncbi:MAG: GHKL domain-containing protein, partial [Spirochaetales bacterium]|nr:GHKL domain-containing protein [Spirochaetales bacterium]
ARSNAELEQFAFIASHDLQEPLRMISCYAQLLEKKYNDKLDKDAREFIWFIVDGAHRMQQLINELLIYSRVNKNVKPFTLVKGQKILMDSLKNLEFKIKDTHAKVNYDPMPEIIADASQLTQLFQNLINNAIKFTKNVPEVNITVSENLDEWIFSVADNGIGIQNDCLESIFEIFRRLHTREEYCGSGIGLSICKKIIERHKGRIWVESEVDKGSRFIFTISKYLSRE